jgi:hypothetical protein
MKLSFSSVIYLFFRLSPFILVCFFVLGSIINNEIKGFVYLVGLIVACCFTSFLMPDGKETETIFLNHLKQGISKGFKIGALAGLSVPENDGGVDSISYKKALVCNSFSINGLYDDYTPMSLAIFSYTFFYLVFPIGKYNLALYNIPTLIMFPLLILGEIFWNVSYRCFPVSSCVIAVIIAGGIGAGWAAIIDRVKLRGLQYFSIGSNREICTKPSQQKFVCKTATKKPI